MDEVSIDTAVNASLFFTTALPILMLCVLCVLALLFGEDFDWPMPVLLINIFAAEIIQWVALSMLYLQRAEIKSDEDYSCNTITSLFITGILQKFFVLTLSAITVYIFARYGIKMKWLPQYVITLWITCIALGSAPYFSSYDSYGLCEISTPAALVKAILHLAAIGSFSAIIVFNMLTYLYVEKSTLLQNPPEVKKEISKGIRYLTVAAVLSLLSIISPASPSSFIGASFKSNGSMSDILLEFIFWVLLNTSALLTPIAAVVILSPLRFALKQRFRSCLKVCRRGKRKEE
jgi:hypothetical protein